MTWIKLEERAPRHPKVSGLSDRAFRVWVTALCYASEFLTDGVLPPVYLITIKAPIRDELIKAKLWEHCVDGVTRIHDYLGHQSDRASVDHKKEINRTRQARYRNALRSASDNALVTQPENREQIQRTDTETTKNGALIVGGAEYFRLLETNAFVGSVLRVPKKLHSELMLKSGANADEKLQAWYLQLNEDLENSGKGTGDVFEFLRPRHQAYALAQGWIDGPPKAGPKPPDPAHIERMLAIERGERRR